MTNTPNPNRADAQKLIERRRRRIWTIRKRAIAGSAAAFAMAWAVIGFQLVSGHDPALSKSTKAATVTSTPAKSKTARSTSSTPSPATTAPQFAPVTTRQS